MGVQKNWSTVTVAPTIEHHDGHLRTPANQRWDQVPGRSQRPIPNTLDIFWDFSMFELYKFLKWKLIDLLG